MKQRFKIKQKIQYVGGALLFLGGLVFFYYSFGLISSLIFGEMEEVSKFLQNENESFNLAVYKGSFWTLISGFIIYFSAGGSLDEINIFRKK